MTRAAVYTSPAEPHVTGRLAVQNPSQLYRFETDTDPRDVRATVLLVALGGFIDAGGAQRLMTDHLLRSLDHTVVASFDLDQMFDYRGRRPVMTFDRDRWSAYADPSLLLHRVIDTDGQPFLVLTGPEPDYQWERFVEAVRELIGILGVTLTVSVNGIPMAVPHTRPIGITAHASDPRLVVEREPIFGTVQVPASVTGLLELRLAESGNDAVGFAIHVPHYLAQADFADAAVAALGTFTGATGLGIPDAELVAAAGLNRAEIAKEVAGSDEVASVVEALERQYDTYVEGHARPSLLATDVSELPSAEEIGAEFEQFLRNQSDEG